MPSPCVNAPLNVKPDGSLELLGARSAAWPFPGAIGTHNGLAFDPGTNNGWAPPETGAAVWYTSAVGPVGPSDGGQNRTGAFTGEIAASPVVTIANNDVNRAALCIFICTLDADVSTYGASIITVRIDLKINGSTYVGTTAQSSQYLSHSNAEGVGQHPSSTFSFGVPLAAGASLNYNVAASYSISAIVNSSQVVTLSMAGRAYVVHN